MCGVWGLRWVGGSGGGGRGGEVTFTVVTASRTHSIGSRDDVTVESGVM